MSNIHVVKKQNHWETKELGLLTDDEFTEKVVPSKMVGNLDK